MPFKTQGPEPLNALFSLRLTAAEKERIKKDAAIAGLSVSEILRRRSVGRPLIPMADLAIVRELRRLGAVLKNSYEKSGGKYSKETATVLDDLKDYLEKLSRGRKED